VIRYDITLCLLLLPDVELKGSASMTHVLWTGLTIIICYVRRKSLGELYTFGAGNFAKCLGQPISRWHFRDHVACLAAYRAATFGSLVLSSFSIAHQLFDSGHTQ
jgi:hypothetical protein